MMLSFAVTLEIYREHQGFMLVSTYELLINKKQFPKPEDLDLGANEEQVNFLEDLSREVIQGYFLTISNLSTADAELNISFRTIEIQSANSPFDEKVTAVLDTNGENREIKPNSSSNVGRISYTVEIKANDTGLFIIQPKPNFIFDPKPENEIEIRGYVDVSSNEQETIDLLLTPEHRATFYRRNENGGDENPIVQLDQIAYALPTAIGGSKFTV